MRAGIHIPDDEDAELILMPLILNLFKMEKKLPIAFMVRIRYTEDMWQVCCGHIGESLWGKGYAWQGQ